MCRQWRAHRKVNLPQRHITGARRVGWAAVAVLALARRKSQFPSHTHAEPGVWPLGQFAPLCSRPVPSSHSSCLPISLAAAAAAVNLSYPAPRRKHSAPGTTSRRSPPSLCVPSVVSNSASSSRKHGSPCAIEVNWACSLCLIHSCLIRPITVGPEPVSLRGRVEDDGCQRARRNRLTA